VIWTFLASPWGQRLLIGGAVLAAIGLAALLIYQQGEAAAASAAAAAVLERIATAARARATVKPNDHGAMDADPFNRDRHS
jgi:hypothetical protein